MRLRIRHATTYRYDQPVDYSIQLIRLTPQNYDGQRILHWKVSGDALRPLPATTDGYGNIVHLQTANRRHAELTVTAEGEVETVDMHGVVLNAPERLPESYFRRSTPLTAPEDTLRALARELEAVGDPVERLHRLINLVRQRISYRPGSTDVATTAAEALAQGSGVCQDYSHVFLAVARLLGHPARYVSGYLWESTSVGPWTANHAWVEAFIEGLGWVGFDPTNGISPTDVHVRVAIGLDYREASPVRGVRRGVADEALAVSVQVEQIQGQQ